MSVVEDTSDSFKSVYDYWFAGDQQVNYRTKWFPAGSKDVQGQADTYVLAHFGSLFDLACAGKLDHWKHFHVDDPEKCRHSFLSLIILLDQFSRHIYRKMGLDTTDPRRCAADELALRCAEEFIAIGASTATTITTPVDTNANTSGVTATWMGADQCSTAEFVFLLMPFRHSATVSRLEFVMKCIDERISQLNAKPKLLILNDIGAMGRDAALEQELELVSKFRKQTLRRLQHLRDRARAAASPDVLEYQGFVMPLCSGVTAVMHSSEPIATPGWDVSKVPVVTGEAELELLRAIREHPLFITTKSFVQRHMPNSTSAIAVSISGGVDSMVVAKILSVMRVSTPDRPSPCFPKTNRVIGIHIDYANREESGREAAYVQHWCGLHGIECHTRTINEVTRGITDRAQYEKVARDIRYNFYQTVGIRVAESEPNSARHLSGVIFGHHQGDVEENVISNVMR